MSDFGLKIYGLFDPETKELRYIGKTQARLSSRLAHHIWRASNTHKKQWILKLLRSGQKPEIDIIEECETNEELIKAEMHHIAQFKSIGCRLVNHTEGGEGCIGYKHGPEAKRKMSERLKGRSSPMKGKGHLLETKLKITMTKTGLALEQIYKIKDEYVSGLDSRTVALRHNVSQTCILSIVRNFGVVRPTKAAGGVATRQQIMDFIKINKRLPKQKSCYIKKTKPNLPLTLEKKEEARLASCWNGFRMSQEGRAWRLMILEELKNAKST